MFYNPNIWLAMVAGIVLFLFGRWLSLRLRARWARSVTLLILIVAALPAVSFFVYYLHVIPENAAYVEWRSQPYVEVLSALVAPLVAFLLPHGIDLRWKSAVRIPAVAIGILFVAVPFIKPILLPVTFGARWANRWEEGVCLQNTPSTCGPASLATILAAYHVKRSEREIARASYSCASGTEIWYLMRYARRQGMQVEVAHHAHLQQVRTPAIIGTSIGGGAGHFIVLLGNGDGRYLIADPLIGRDLVTEEQFQQKYDFTGYAVSIRQPGGRQIAWFVHRTNQE